MSSDQPQPIVCPNAHTDIVARLEKATGPSRELDAKIALACGWSVFPGDNWIGPHAEICVPDWTSSLDASLALVGERLPGAMWRVGFDPDDGSKKAEIVTDAPECRRIVSNHDTAPLAVLLSLFRALKANDGE